MKEINSLYIHFPFCQHLCNYCDFYKHKLENEKQVIDFEIFLNKQFEYHQSYLSQNGYKLGKLETLYIGGGTPSLWKKRGAQFLKSFVERHENCEFTIEIDPDTWVEGDIDRWQEIGVNRFSLGSQAYSEKFLKVMDRTHLLSDVEKSVKYFSERGLNFSVDLMLGLPGSEGERNIQEELRGLLKYSPSHFSVYILKTRKNYLLNTSLPSDDYIRGEYLEVSEMLSKNGYNHYEVSNFAKKDKKSKHNIKYWNYASVAALGPNATGLLVDKDRATRYQWKSISLGVSEEVLEGSSLIIEKLFLGLRHKNKFDFFSIFKEEEKLSLIDELLEHWKKLGYIESSSHRHGVDLTALGFLMCDSLLDDVFSKISF